jgi:aminopeptidase N
MAGARAWRSAGKKIVQSARLHAYSQVMQHLFALLIGMAAATAAPLPHYDLQLNLEPQREFLKVAGALTLPVSEDNQSEAKFYLNRGFELTSLRCAECASYTFDRTQFGALRFAPDASPVLVHFRRPLRRGEELRIEFAYEGKLVRDAWGTNFAGPDAVELAVYCAWYPLQSSPARSTYDVTAHVAPPWRAAGAGEVTQPAPGTWRVRQPLPTVDITVVASPALKERTLAANGTELHLYWAGLPEAKVEAAARSSLAVLQMYQEWFGPAAAPRLTLFFSDRTRGGGYARPGYITYTADYITGLPEAALTRALTHEIAHLWWHLGAGESWEDWLNESFAEYSALLAVRQIHGAAAFDAMLAAHAQGAANTPPLRGFDRRSNSAEATLYQKGPMILNAAEQRLGSKTFLAFLAALNRDQVATTDGVLTVLERVGNREARLEVERLLDAPGWAGAQPHPAPGQ